MASADSIYTLKDTVRELFNKIMAKRHRLCRIISSSLELLAKSANDAADADGHFRGLMKKHRLWNETRNQAKLVVHHKLRFIEIGGDELRQCLTDFYLELVRDIELLGGLNVERDQNVYRYVLDKLRNERGCKAVALQAEVLAAQIEQDSDS